MTKFRYNAPASLFDITDFIYAPSFVNTGLKQSNKHYTDIHELAERSKGRIQVLTNGAVYAEGSEFVHEFEWLIGDPVREYSNSRMAYYRSGLQPQTVAIPIGGTLLRGFTNIRKYKQTSLSLFHENVLMLGEDFFVIDGEVDDPTKSMLVQVFARQFKGWQGFESKVLEDLDFSAISRQPKILRVSKTKVTFELDAAEEPQSCIDFLVLACHLSEALYCMGAITQIMILGRS